MESSYRLRRIVGVPHMADVAVRVGCQLVDLRCMGLPRWDQWGVRRSRWQGRSGPVRAERPCSQKLSGVAVFVDQPTKHVNSLHRRPDGVRLDQCQM
jgi:hypothetical protein